MMTSWRSLHVACLGLLMASPVWTSAQQASDSGEATDEAAQNEVDQSQKPVRVYVVPIRGQVGTDIVPRIYEEVVEDITEMKPDIVLFELESSDDRNVFDDSQMDIFEGEMFDPNRERSMMALSEMQELRIMLEDEIPTDIRQVLWVHDAVGASAALGLSWEDFYMTPDAQIGKMGAAVMGARKAAGDANVEAKFGMASYQDLVKITRYGDGEDVNPTRKNLINAMAMPELSLSVFMSGRQYVMGNHDKYVEVLDGSDKIACQLSARNCDDFCISDGTAETLEDLMVLLGERQFVVVEGKASEIVEDHHEGWRAAYARAIDSYMQYQKWIKRAKGDNFKACIGKAEKALKMLRGSILRYPEVGRRMGGLTTDRIDIMLKELEKMKRTGKGSPGGGGGGGGRRGPTGS